MPRSVLGTVAYVDRDRPPGGDGASWESAFDDLQDALDLADGDPTITEIWVAQGIYRPDRGTGDRTTSFKLINSLAVYGGFSGVEKSRDKRDPDMFVTVLSGDLNDDDGPNFANYGDNSYHVVDAINAHMENTLDGFTITAGNAVGERYLNDRGGGMIIHNGRTDVVRCIFQGNKAMLGGAVYCEALNPTIIDSSFIENQAEDGGAVYIRNASLSVFSCDFIGNAATRGGALLVADGAPQVISAFFFDNTAQFGGAVCNSEQGALIIAGSTFESNAALSFDNSFARGGAVESLGGTLTLLNCTLRGNLAFSTNNSPLMAEGGAVYIDDSPAAITNCLFEYNVADRGGGFREKESSSQISGCTFNGNLALDCGGGYAGLDSATTITGTSFTGNFAQKSGGGICSWNGQDLLVTACFFSGNGADDQGGGFSGYTFSSTQGTAYTLLGCVFVDNAANEGGAISSFANGEIQACSVTGNWATTDGGGLYVDGRSVAVTGTTLAGNFCVDGSGGGVFVDEAVLSMDGCTVQGNAATDEGGGLFADSADLSVQSCAFVGNTAARGAGMLLVGFASRSVTNCTVAANQALTAGGGVLNETGTTELVQCVLWANESDTGMAEAAQLLIEAGDATPQFCCVQGLTGLLGGVGNIDSDPDFIRDPDDGGDGWGVGDNDDFGDVHLMIGSPSVNAGSPGFTPAKNTLDIDGEIRLQVCRVDIGADESPNPGPDCNGNGEPDACDLLDGTSLDCNQNGVPDTCDLAGGFSTDCDGNEIPDECDPDCNANGVPDVCDIAGGGSDDCNGTGVPDECEIVLPIVITASEPLSPIGSNAPQSFMMFQPPEAGGDVTLSFAARGDLNNSSDFIDVDINGMSIGTIFALTGTTCADPPDQDQLVVSAALFNQAASSGQVVAVNMVPSSSVWEGACLGTSYIQVELTYDAAFPTDADENGILDECECPGDCAMPPDGETGVVDLLALLAQWGGSPSSCDLDGDGMVGIEDFLALLGLWGPCP